MVYESDFSRRQFLDSCAQSGMFYSSPGYKPNSTLNFRSNSTLGASSTIPATGSRSERTARLLASLSTNSPTQPAYSPAPPVQFRRSFDPEHPYTSSELDGTNRYVPVRSSGHGSENGHERSCCACCKNNCSGRARPKAETFLPIGTGANLKTQDSMESYIKSRRPLHGDDDTFQLKTMPTYSVRNIPVRSLDELRETVAIRRNYIKERNQQPNNDSLALPFLQNRGNSASPQPDGSIVTYPSENNEDRRSVSAEVNTGGGSYNVVDEHENA